MTIAPERLATLLADRYRIERPLGAGGRRRSIWRRRIPLDGGPPSATMSIRNDQWFGVTPDGSLETIRTDSTSQVAWYRLAPGGSDLVRLGDAPTQGTTAPSPFNDVAWGNSEDGRRFVVVKSVDRPDIYLLRNFGDVLKR